MTERRQSESRMVDWDLAVRFAEKIAGDGPSTSPVEAAGVVAELREGAERSTGLVRDFTGLVASDHSAPVLIVDRPGWIQANADAFAQIIDPLAEKLAEGIAAKSKGRSAAPGGVGAAIGSKVTGGEIGLVLGFLSGKVLGQFDPFHPDAGRLLLVAPNIVHVERELSVDPHDFRLWVCLHEETHRVQFTAVPWMREHLFSQVRELTDAIDPGSLTEDGIKRIAEAVRASRSDAASRPSLMELMSTPEQRAIMDRVTGMMSLLEGHADVVMDGVGPQVIPSVNAIRNKFNQRRQGVGVLDKLLRRLLGLDAKMAQYRDGAAFVREVVAHAGMAGFNEVWVSADRLPTKDEILTPSLWIQRVLGD